MLGRAPLARSSTARLFHPSLPSSAPVPLYLPACSVRETRWPLPLQIVCLQWGSKAEVLGWGWERTSSSWRALSSHTPLETRKTCFPEGTSVCLIGQDWSHDQHLPQRRLGSWFIYLFIFYPPPPLSLWRGRWVRPLGTGTQSHSVPCILYISPL